MPEEVAIIAVVAIIGGTLSTVVKHVLEYLKSKNRSSSSDSSMTTSELQSLLRATVQEATEPLTQRLALLERRLESKTAGGEEKDLLEDMDSYVAPDPVSAAPARRTRA